MVGWLVGNIVFSEMALKIFLIFCMKLGNYKGRKFTELDFWKKFLIWRYSQKGLQVLQVLPKVSPRPPQNQTLIFFSKTSLTIFFGFWPEVSTKYDLQFQWNLFFRKMCNLEIFDLEIVKKLPRLRLLVIFSTLHHLFSLILHIMIGGHDV